MRAILFLLFLFVTITLPGQELFFSSLTAFQNLPSSETYDILQDSKGFIWFTTDAGVCKYDGTQLKVFTKKDGIAENVVFKVYEDNKNRIWFTTISGYFFYYQDNAFHSIAANERLKQICTSFPMNSFFIGEQDTLYCATNLSSCLLKIPPQNNYKEVIMDSSLAHLCSRFLVQNKLHPEECIIGNGKIIQKETSYLFLVNHNVLKISNRLEDSHSGNLWKGRTDIHGNVYMPYGKQLDIFSKESLLKGTYYCPGNIITTYVDPDNDLWVCTSHGGYLYKNSDLSKTPIHFLTNLSVSAVYMDREGTVWATTIEKGVFRTLNKHLLFFNDNNNTDKDKAVYLQKDSNRLNVSFRSKKIILLYKNDSLHVNDIITKVNSKNNLISSYIDNRFLLFGLYTESFFLDKKKTSAPVKFNIRSNVIEFLKIGMDSILILTPYGISLFHGVESKIIKTPFPGKFILQLKNKKILISARNNSGIYEFELKNKKLIVYLPQLSSTRVNCMAEDRFGNLWIATNEKGLYCYTASKKLFHLSTKSNLIGDKINTLTIDEQNNLWLGSYNGLAKLSFAKGFEKVEITNFNKSHGIPSTEIERICSFNEKIACVSKEYFFYIDNHKLKKNTVPPLNYIESVFINDKLYDVQSKPVLNYNENNFHVISSLITYKNTEQRRFLYKLVGYDQIWQYSTSGDVLYTNLSHGKYEFIIYGLNNDNLKSYIPATFSFEIRRPFWFTWWFILLEVGFVFAAIYFYFRYWKNKIEKREHEKVIVNQKMAEFKMTALRSQMNPHFIFNAIGSIQHYILKNEIKQSYNYLSKFSMLIRNILNNSRQEYISLTQEINTLRLYIELEQIRFTHPFQFKIEIDEELDMEMDIPTMLIQPYVENSIWHGLMPKESDGILELQFKKTDHSMLVIIRDNGMGRKIVDPEKKHVSKGMSITEQRIDALATTNKKKFITMIIDLKDENGNSIGTEVNLTIPLDLE